MITIAFILLIFLICWGLQADSRAATRRPLLLAGEKPAEQWQWRYRVWMPKHWQRLAECESGSKPPNWKHNSGTYQGAFGFHRDSWDDRRYRPRRFPAEAYNATPWQQWYVAREIGRRYGLASPWGCWRGSDHAWVRGGLPEYGTYK